MLQEQPSKKSADIPLPHWTTCWRKKEARKSYDFNVVYPTLGNDIIWVFFTQSKIVSLLIGEAPAHPPNRWTVWWLHTTKAPIVGAWQHPSWWDRFPGPKKTQWRCMGGLWYSGGGEVLWKKGEICSKTWITYITYLIMKYTMYHRPPKQFKLIFQSYPPFGGWICVGNPSPIQVVCLLCDRSQEEENSRISKDFPSIWGVS